MHGHLNVKTTLHLFISYIPATCFDCKQSLLGSLLNYVNKCIGTLSVLK